MKIWLTGTSADISGERQKVMHDILHVVRPLGLELGATMLFNTLVLLLQKMSVEKDGAITTFAGVWDAQAEYATKTEGT